MTFEIPEELRASKETWFKVFTNQSLLATLAFASVGWFFKIIITACGAPLAGWVVLGLFAAVGFLLFTIRIPGTSVLRGGRLLLAQKFWRWFLHRLNKGVYLPVYIDEEEEEIPVAEKEPDLPTDEEKISYIV